jgi:hypothetical protein
MADVSENTKEAMDGDEWEPLFDVPDNLRRDGSNYVEWIWSLLDDGIDIPLSGSFAELRTAQDLPLLDADIAAYLDDQLKIARRGASVNGHDLADVITCCNAPNTDSGGLADQLIQLFFHNKTAAVARARSLGEICDAAEDFNKAAIYLKFDLATDDTLPRVVRDALNGPVEVP